MALTLQRPGPQTQGLGSRSLTARQMGEGKLGGIITLLLSGQLFVFCYFAEDSIELKR